MMLNRPLIIIGHTSLIINAEDLALENLVPAMRGKDRNKLTQLLIDFSSVK